MTLPRGRPDVRRLVTFLLLIALLDGCTLAVVTLAPPDPGTTLFVVGPMLLLAPLLAYLLVYRLPRAGSTGGT